LNLPRSGVRRFEWYGREVVEDRLNLTRVGSIRDNIQETPLRFTSPVGTSCAPRRQKVNDSTAETLAALPAKPERANRYGPTGYESVGRVRTSLRRSTNVGSLYNNCI
jgi:hypothetical protein